MNDRWNSEVPGARFFRADLHIHTLDDHPSPNFTWPPGLNGDPSDQLVQSSYARAFLDAACESEIEVLGLTPHSARVAPGGESATWRIVETWATESADDGVPYRDKIRCVFPGFEVSANAGADGLHFIFLFDPSISKSSYLQAFETVMQGRWPWLNGSLQNSPRGPLPIFQELSELSRMSGFGFLAFCPHAFSTKGLFNALKSQVLADFPADLVAALELQDNETLDERLAKAPDWQRDGFNEHRNALIHASDAYALVSGNGQRGIGYRHSLLKLAAPTLESLRQSLLANDSRVRCCFKRAQHGLEVNEGLSVGLPTARSWLRSLTVSGGGSFFGREADGSPREEVFHFSPDLTCVIGGRLTGKSTLLDGMRRHFDASLPEDESVRRDVLDRGGRFVAEAEITADVVGEWGAQFFTQRELQMLARDDEALTELVFSFSTAHRDDLRLQRISLRALDRELTELVGQITRGQELLEEHEQLVAEATGARTRLETLVNAGVDDLWASQRDVAKAKAIAEQGAAAQVSIASARSAIQTLALPEFEVPGNREVEAADARATRLADLKTAIDDVEAKARLLTESLEASRNRAGQIESSASAVITEGLIQAGQSADEIGRYESLRTTAALVDEREAALGVVAHGLQKARDTFESKEAARNAQLASHRELVDQALTVMNDRLKGRVNIVRIPSARHESLETYLLGLKRQGLTRWWNSTEEHPDPVRLRSALEMDDLAGVGMTAAVGTSFKEAITSEGELMLRALRSEDAYRVEMNVGGEKATYRDLSRLSGGAQVSTLLTVLLESEDGPPLVIDQPEDEIDSAFLWDTVLPALRRLKGRRQIIFATHDANVVVNGDADLVVQLAAQSDRAWVEAAGAIEDPEVRAAIVATVDGGPEAFDLRRTKYGF